MHLALIIAIGWKGLLSVHRLIGDLASQTALPDATAISLLTNTWPDDVLLFETTSYDMVTNNLRDELAGKDRPKERQLSFWKYYTRTQILGKTTGERLAMLSEALALYIVSSPSSVPRSRTFGIEVTQPRPSLTSPPPLGQADHSTASSTDARVTASDDLGIRVSQAAEFEEMAIHRILEPQDIRGSTMYDEVSHNSWVTCFDDDDVMHPERMRYIRQVIERDQEVDIVLTGLTRPLVKEETYLQLLIWRDERYGLEPDKASGSWQQAREFNDLFGLPKRCNVTDETKDEADANAARARGKSLIELSAIHDMWQADFDVLFHSPPFHYPDFTKSKIRADVERDANRSVTYSGGWFSIRREVAEMQPPTEYEPDEGLHWHWYLVSHHCSKLQVYPSELGLYINPRPWEY